MTFQEIFNADIEYAEKPSQICRKFFDRLKEIRRENVFIKWNLYVAFQNQLKLEKDIPPPIIPEQVHILHDFWLNIRIYEQILGILYMHPCYMFNLFATGNSTDEGILFTALHHLYTDRLGLGMGTKNKSY